MSVLPRLTERRDSMMKRITVWGMGLLMTLLSFVALSEDPRIFAAGSNCECIFCDPASPQSDGFCEANPNNPPSSGAYCGYPTGTTNYQPMPSDPDSDEGNVCYNAFEFSGGSVYVTEVDMQNYVYGSPGTNFTERPAGNFSTFYAETASGNSEYDTYWYNIWWDDLDTTPVPCLPCTISSNPGNCTADNDTAAYQFMHIGEESQSYYGCMPVAASQETGATLTNDTLQLLSRQYSGDRNNSPNNNVTAACLLGYALEVTSGKARGRSFYSIASTSADFKVIKRKRSNQLQRCKEGDLCCPMSEPGVYYYCENEAGWFKYVGASNICQ